MTRNREREDADGADPGRTSYRFPTPQDRRTGGHGSDQGIPPPGHGPVYSNGRFT